MPAQKSINSQIRDVVTDLVSFTNKPDTPPAWKAMISDKLEETFFSLKELWETISEFEQLEAKKESVLANRENAKKLLPPMEPAKLEECLNGLFPFPPEVQSYLDKYGSLGNPNKGATPQTVVEQTQTLTPSVNNSNSEVIESKQQQTDSSDDDEEDPIDGDVEAVEDEDEPNEDDVQDEEEEAEELAAAYA